MNFDPTQHDYIEHHTYTGFGCAHCGRSIAEHNSALIVKEVPRSEAVKTQQRYAVNYLSGKIPIQQH